MTQQFGPITFDPVTKTATFPGALLASNFTNPSGGPAFPVFVPDTIGGTPQTATLVIPAGGPSERVALPAGNYLRLTWTGSGPFAYRQGDSAVVALSTDTPAIPGYGGVIASYARVPPYTPNNSRIGGFANGASGSWIGRIQELVSMGGAITSGDRTIFANSQKHRFAVAA
jgi:hypothetical protein